MTDELIYPDAILDDLHHLLQKNLAEVESVFHIELALRGNKIMFDGEAAKRKKFKKFVDQLIHLVKVNGQLNENDLKISLQMARNGKIGLIPGELTEKAVLGVNGKEVFPKTYHQNVYIKAISKNDLVFCIGPAGTGKTFLAIAMALQYLLNREVERIVLTRPVVEAGEKLGFLPGDVQQKVNPYFRPLYDALYFLIGFEKTSDLIDRGIIEIAPLAYMRGRTINNAFIILDEGQNTSNSQMKMFLTRFGQSSKVIVTADISQIDLPDPKKSGIFKAMRILAKIKGISFINFDATDVVRHDLVQKIIEAYERKKDEV